MIPRAYINAWSNHAPWPTEEQIEQDLVLSRLIVEIANDKLLGEEFAFRGGTCLHKLHLANPLRYSEDLDYVRTNDEARLGECFDSLRALASGLGLSEVRRAFPTKSSGNGTIWFDGASESGQGVIRVKIETNVAETVPLYGYNFIDYEVASPWWSGGASVRTFIAEEILATKIRALCQRRKGRDLFDLWIALNDLDLDDEMIVRALQHYMKDAIYSYPQLRQHLEKKISDREFLSDVTDLTTDLRGLETERAAALILERIGLKLRNVPQDRLT